MQCKLIPTLQKSAENQPFVLLQYTNKLSLFFVGVRLFLFIYLDDEVYMPNTSDLEEYILNDQGVLFQGSSSHISPLRWYIGQVCIFIQRTYFPITMVYWTRMTLDHEKLLKW